MVLGEKTEISEIFNYVETTNLNILSRYPCVSVIKCFVLYATFKVCIIIIGCIAVDAVGRACLTIVTVVLRYSICAVCLSIRYVD